MASWLYGQRLEKLRFAYLHCVFIYQEGFHSRTYLHEAIQCTPVQVHTPHYSSLIHHARSHHIHWVWSDSTSQSACETGTRWTNVQERPGWTVNFRWHSQFGLWIPSTLMSRFCKQVNFHMAWREQKVLSSKLLFVGITEPSLPPSNTDHSLKVCAPLPFLDTSDLPPMQSEMRTWPSTQFSLHRPNAVLAGLASPSQHKVKDGTVLGKCTESSESSALFWV